MTNNTTAALTDDFRGDDANLISSIKALIELNDEGALVPHGIGSHARSLLSAAAVRLTSPRAAVPSFSKHELTAIRGLLVGSGYTALMSKVVKMEREANAAPAAPVDTPAPDPLRRRVERLLVELHAEGRLSEGQCAKMLDISRVDWRELAEFLAPGAQAVAADGESAYQWVAETQSEFVSALILAICELPDRSSPEGEPGAMVANSDEIAHCVNAALDKTGLIIGSPLAVKQCAAVSPATADERAALQWTAGTLQEIVSGRWKGAKESDKVSIGSVTKTVAQVLDMADAALGRASQAAAPAEAREPDAYVPIHPRNGPLWASTVTSLDADRPKSYPVKPVYLGASADAGEAASIENPLTPYGMLVRALRIVANTTLMDMATAMNVSPAFLSSLEFGRRQVTYDNAAFASGFFSDKGIVDTLPALAHAVGLSQGAQGGKGGEA